MIYVYITCIYDICIYNICIYNMYIWYIIYDISYIRYITHFIPSNSLTISILKSHYIRYTPPIYWPAPFFAGWPLPFLAYAPCRRWMETEIWMKTMEISCYGTYPQGPLWLKKHSEPFYMVQAPCSETGMIYATKMGIEQCKIQKKTRVPSGKLT